MNDRMLSDLHIMAAGDFGYAIARQISDLTGASIGDALAPVVTWREAALRVFVSWRPLPTVERALDDEAFETDTCWLPVVCHHPIAQFGPLVVPRMGPCFHCAKTRFLQHSPLADVWEALDAAYADDTRVGPAGFLPTHATIIAATAVRVIERYRNAVQREAGVVRLLDLISMEALCARVVGVHGCPRCAGVPEALAGSTGRSIVTLLQGTRSTKVG
jgi:bacteriocin biosynthesis cyclodehydratase domain-containing protein